MRALSTILVFLFVYAPFSYQSQAEPLNQAPVARTDSSTTFKNTSRKIYVLNNDTDPDGTIDSTSVTKIFGPKKGIITIHISNGTISYLPFPNACGLDSFSYKVKDNEGLPSNMAWVYIDISCANIAPRAKNDSVEISEDQTIVKYVADNDDLNDGPSEYYSILTPATHGTATITSIGYLTYNPDKYFHGRDTVAYLLCDGATPELCDTAFVFINILEVSTAPIAQNDTASTIKNQPVSVFMFANDEEDEQIDTSSFVLLRLPLSGLVNIDFEQGKIIYSPFMNSCGIDSFSYRFRDDENLLSNIAFIYVDVSCANLYPVSEADYLFTSESLPISVDLSANDLQTDGPSAAYSILTAPEHGSAGLSLTGSLTYTPDPEFIGKDTLRYLLCDNGSPQLCDTGWVYIKVDSMKSIPLANNDTAFVIEKGSVIINILQNDMDMRADLDPATVLITTATIEGTFSYNGDSLLTYTPFANSPGTHVFTYTVENIAGNISNPASVTVNVIADKPLTASELCGNVTGRNRPVVLYVLSETEDVSPDPSSVKVLGSGAEHGTLSAFNPSTGSFTYTPHADYIGNDEFYFSVQDYSGLLTDTARVCIEVEKDKVQVPSAFTPNNDGKNEKWILRGIEQYPDNEVMIYNRTGIEVLHITGYNQHNAWDGAALNRGTYYYIVKINDEGRNHTYTGYLTLLK